MNRSTLTEYIHKNGIPPRETLMKWIENENTLAEQAASYILNTNPTKNELIAICLSSESHSTMAWRLLRPNLDVPSAKRLLRGLELVGDGAVPIQLDVWFNVLRLNPSPTDLAQIADVSSLIAPFAIHDLFVNDHTALLDHEHLPASFKSYLTWLRRNK